MCWRGLIPFLCALACAAPAAADPASSPSPLCCTPIGEVSATEIVGDHAWFGGNFRHVGPVTGAISRLDPVTGRPISGFPLINGFVAALVSDGAGGWYVGGNFTTAGGLPRTRLAHIEADGTVDPDWVPTVSGTVWTMAVAGGSVWIGGEFDTVNGTARTGLAALDPVTGTLRANTPVLSGGAASVRALAYKESTLGARLFVGGVFSGGDGNARPNLLAIDAGTGAVVTAFDPKPNGPVLSLEVDGGPNDAPANWTVWVGGFFTGVAGPGSMFPAAMNRVAKVNGDDGKGFGGFTPPPALDGAVLTLIPTAARIYIGGTFTAAGKRGLAALAADGTLDGTWAPDLSAGARVESLLLRDGKVYAGGRFASVNGTPRSNVAAFDATTGAVDAWDPDALTEQFGVKTLVDDGTSLVAGGDLLAIGEQPRSNLAAINLRTGALAPVAPVVDGPVRALALGGDRLFLGGDFDHVGAAERHNLAGIDPATGAATAFDPNANGPVQAVAATPSTVYAAGDFTTVNGATLRGGIAGFDAATGVAGAFSPALVGVIPRAFALAVDADDVYIGGVFTKVNGADRVNLAAVRDVPGTTGLLTGLRADTTGAVRALLVDGPTLYVGGQFTDVATQPRSRLVAVVKDTGALLPWFASADGPVTALARAGDVIVAGGRFDIAGVAPRAGIAAFTPDTGALTEWNPGLDRNVLALESTQAAGLVVAGRPTGLGSQVAGGTVAAFALRPAAPGAPAATAGDGTATVTVAAPPDGGSPITSYAVTVQPGGQVVTAAAGPFTFTGLTNGTAYTFTATARNAVGASAASPPSEPVTPAAPTPTAEPTAEPTATADTTPPVLSGLSMTRKRFRVGARGRGAATRRGAGARPRAAPHLLASAAAKRGSAFTFRLSERATVPVRLQRVLPGRRRGKRCVAPKKGRGKACKRLEAAGRLPGTTLDGGRRRIAFSGRVGRRKLRPGRYRARLVATDPAGNRSKPAFTAFGIVRR